MEHLINKLKIYIPIAITVLSSAMSGILLAKNYFDTNFVKVGDYSQIKTTVTIGVLENRKAILENRLYFLDMCKTTPTCSYRGSALTDIDKTLRELADVRGHLESVRSKRIED
jgi:hypothetical protein